MNKENDRQLEDMRAELKRLDRELGETRKEITDLIRRNATLKLHDGANLRAIQMIMFQIATYLGVEPRHAKLVYDKWFRFYANDLLATFDEEHRSLVLQIAESLGIADVIETDIPDLFQQSKDDT